VADMQDIKDDSENILRKFVEILSNSSERMRVPNQMSALAYIGDQMNTLNRKLSDKSLQITAR
jgi:ethanolamine ammonia-lyase large subunit